MGALVNGVFLVALCLTIFLEAIQRFVEPQIVTNPRLVLIVGCLGLASNILGLFLFHEHGHSHGGSGGGHNHGGVDEVTAAEEGHGNEGLREHDVVASEIANERGNIADVLPQTTIGGWPNSSTATEAHGKPPKGYSKSDEDDSTAADSTSPLSTRKSNVSTSVKRHRRHTSGSRSRFASVDDIHIHPASFRNDIIAAGRLDDIESAPGTDSEGENAVEEEPRSREESPLRDHARNYGTTKQNGTDHHDHDSSKRHDSWHQGHNHSQPKATEGGGGHSHGDLNMRGVFLHVMGDALGNIGVIASALIIWLTHYSWRYYCDPAISLVITIIILGSAIPLCRAASRILLQAVPAGISIDEITEDIMLLPGIISCHHVHVWQLSDTKLVASLHVQVEYDFKGEGSARYMQLAHAIRHCLHEYGIHSSTIQPEFCLDSEHRHIGTAGSDGEDIPQKQPGSSGSGSGNGLTPKAMSKSGSRAASMRSEADACLLDCGDRCGDNKQCCSPNTGDTDGSDKRH